MSKDICAARDLGNHIFNEGYCVFCFAPKTGDNTMDMTEEDRKELADSTEKLTQEILVQAAGPMLAAGMSESAVVRMCENVSSQYHERLLNRYKAELEGK